MAYFSEEFITRVKDANPIEDVVGERVSLRNAGKNKLGLCPFHHEKTPSFTVSPGRAFFHCFGCGKGGNVYQFLMDYEGLTFPEAVEFLARRAHIPLEGGAGSATAQAYAESRRQSQNRMYELCHFAAAYFAQELHGSSRAAEAREYLASRDIKEETQRAFQLGYAPDEWDALIHAAKKKGFSEEELLRAGLVIEREGGGVYDRFRRRIIFPVWDLTGRVIAFGGRAMGDDTPKYLNSPETALYRKSGVLYPLYHTKFAIKEKKVAIVCEGYCDAIMLAQHRFTYCVAVCGTAVTREHAHVLARFTKKVVLAFDGDTAGQNAALQTMGVFIGEGMDVSIASLDVGDDPDTLLRRDGRDAFAEVVKNATPFFAFLLRRTAEETGIETPQERQEFLRQISAILVQIENTDVRAEYCREAAQYLSMPEARVERICEEYMRARKTQDNRDDPEHVAEKAAEGASAAERLFLALIVRDDEAVKYAYTHCDISFIEHPLTYAIVEKIYALVAEDAWPGTAIFLQELDDASAGYVTECMSTVPDDDTQSFIALKECITTLHIQKYTKEKHRLTAALKTAEGAEIADLMHRIKKYDTLIYMHKSPPTEIRQ